MIVCKECGTRMPENVAACPNCGAAVLANPVDANYVERQLPPTEETSDSGWLGPSMKKALLAASVAVAASVGLIIWQMKIGHVSAINLSAEDMTMIAENQEPQNRILLARDADERKRFARDLREKLALAEEARRSGFAARPEVRTQLEFSRALILARNYVVRQNEAGIPESRYLPQSEVEAYFKEPGWEKKFEELLSLLRRSRVLPAGELQPEDKAEIQHQLGRVMVAARKGEAAGFDRERKVELLLQFQEATILSRLYSDETAKRFEASQEEVRSYVTGARAQAEQVLARARAGQDFAKLAREFSTDPTVRENGGDLGWLSRGDTVESFEDAAFALKEGEVSDIVQTPFGYHIIKLEERRMLPLPNGQHVEQVRVRHILFLTLQQQLGAVLAEKKRQKFLDTLLARTRIQVAEDYRVSPPQFSPQDGFPPAAGGDAQ